MKSTKPEVKEPEIDLIIPVYLDVNVLLDLLASIEDGFSIVQKITTQKITENTNKGLINTEFGIPNITNFLKISLGGSIEKQQAKGSKEKKSLERYHTYGSLFYKFRSNLIKNKIVKSFTNNTNWKDVKPFDFVEIKGIFIYNPLAETLLNLERLIEILKYSITIFPQTNQKDKRNIDSETKQIEGISKFISSLRASLEPGNTYTFIIKMSDNSNYKGIITLFSEYLRDKTMRELINGEFRVLGKVVKNYKEEPIDLFSGTGFDILGDININSFLNKFSQLKEQGYNIPEIKGKIEPPILQILPIAIYV